MPAGGPLDFVPDNKYRGCNKKNQNTSKYFLKITYPYELEEESCQIIELPA